MTIDIEPKHLDLVKNILAQAVNAEFYVFGSRVKGTAKKYSDLDIFYRGEIPRDLLLKIKSDLRESNLPIKVDLVAYEQLPQGYADLNEVKLALR